MAEVTVSWFVHGDGPDVGLREETYQTERSAAEALLAKDWDSGIIYRIAGHPITRRTVELVLEGYQRRQADAERRAQRYAAEAAALAAARREAVAEMLLCQTSGIWKDRIERVPNLKWARKLLADPEMVSLRDNVLANADQLIAAYEGASV